MPNPIDGKNPPMGILVYPRGNPGKLGLTKASKPYVLGSGFTSSWLCLVKVEWLTGKSTWRISSSVQSIEEKLLEDYDQFTRLHAEFMKAKKVFGIT